MRHKAASTQADVNAIMARTFPTSYRPTTAEELAVALRPIAAMRFTIGQDVSHYLTRQSGVLENCTMYTDGRLKYVVAWTNGRREWVWESDLRAERNGGGER